MVSIGEEGYLEAARRIMETATWIKDEIAHIPELKVIGDPLFVIAFQSDSLNAFQVLEYMTERKWGLNGLHLPPAIHLCVTLRHTQPGVKERLIKDLKAAVDYVKENPQAPEGIGPVYGMASSIETLGMVKHVLNWYMDTQYRV
jgi:glutamate/tyrosine decarboxylase-like PLP-dependent enzyme